MQNLLVSASAMPSPVSVVSAVSDVASVSAPNSQDFSAVLARELIAKTSKPETDSTSPDAATSDSQPDQSVSESVPLQIPSDLGSIALALAPGTVPFQPDERSLGHQRSIRGKAPPAALTAATSAARIFPQATLHAVLPASESGKTAEIAAPGSFPPVEPSSGLPHSIPGNALPTALAGDTSASGNFLQAALPGSVPPDENNSGHQRLIPGAAMPGALAAETSAPRNFPQAALAGSPPPDVNSSRHQRLIPGEAMPDALEAETSAPRNLPQAALAGRRVSGTANTAEIAAPGSPPPDVNSTGDQRSIAGSAMPGALAAETSAPRELAQATRPDRPAFESAKTAGVATPGGFQPPVAAEERTQHSGTAERVTQRLPEGAPLPQMANPFGFAAASPAPASAATTRDLTIDTRIGAPGWSGELAQKVVWMATQQQQTAELHLNPPHLGPVEVMLTIGNDQGTQASIQFASPHSAAREAIESALPRLREMMADSGIALGNVTVSADSFQQNAEAGRQHHSIMKPPADLTETGARLAAAPAVTPVRGGHNRLVDTFA